MSIKKEGFVLRSDIKNRAYPPPVVFRGDTQINASLDFFGSILHWDDNRWEYPEKYAMGKERSSYRGIHWEAALQAIYLSDKPSFRNQYSKYVSHENRRQLGRAIENLSVYQALKHMYDSSSPEFQLPTELEIKLARTGKITKGVDADNVTGCPEALYQLRMFKSNGRGRYIGRIGFNVHFEDDVAVFSVTNIQGIPGGLEYCSRIKQEHGIRPFNTMIKRLKLLAAQSPAEYEIRGYKNNSENPGLYNTVFKKEGIKRVSFDRNSTDSA